MNDTTVPSVQSWDDLVRFLTPHFKRHYSVEEFAKEVKRRPFTVREWCRLGRIKASKSMTQSGPALLWVIGHEELERFRRDGLLPLGSTVPRAEVMPSIVARVRHQRRSAT